jgi:nicotinate dehydrogenase subunit B
VARRAPVSDLAEGKGITRAQFLKGAGALIVGFSWLGTSSRVLAAAPGPAPSPVPRDLESTPSVDSWLKVDSSGSVTILSGKVDLGQGLDIAFPQIVADELYVTLDQIGTVVLGDTALTPNEGFTAGSLSIEAGGMSLRYAAAAAREKLLALASAKLGTPASNLTIQNGVISAPGGASVSYGALIGGRKFNVTVNPASPPPLKPYQDYTLVGKPLPRETIPDIATGAAPVFVQSLQLPNMLYGRVLRPPSPWAQLQALHAGPVEAMPGVVKVVRNGSYVAVVAETEGIAVQALEALRSAAVWTQTNRFPSMDDIYTYLRESQTEDVAEAVFGRSEGVYAAAPAARKMEATYTVPYLAHASIGTSAAVGLFANGKYTIWSHTQGPFPDQQALSYLLNVPTSQIRVIHMNGSGCYGHNGADDALADAALLARAVPDHPIKVQWLRADEFQWEPYGSAMVMRIQAALTAGGTIACWNHDLWGGTYSTRPGGAPGWLMPGWYLAQPQLPGEVGYVGTDRNLVPYYTFPAERVYCHYVLNSPLRVSAHRTLGAFRNVFAIESFMDEMAVLAKADPIAFRLKHLTDPRAIAVIQAAAKAAGWNSGVRPTKRGFGFAFTRYENAAAYVATVAQVSVSAKGAVRVENIWSAVDVGQVINPNGINLQAEGGAIQATSWTLKEQVTWNETSITSVDWVTYPILRFSEVPNVHVIQIDHPEISPVGFGEAACVPIGAAIANAVYDAVGARVRDLPLNPAHVSAAMA